MERQVEEEMDFWKKGAHLTLHGDLNGAVLLPHVVARCAPVDACAVHGQVPQSHNFWVLQICEGKKRLGFEMKRPCDVTFQQSHQYWLLRVTKLISANRCCWVETVDLKVFVWSRTVVGEKGETGPPGSW